MFHFTKTLVFANIFLMISGYDGLLIDKLRWNFLSTEDNLWAFVLYYPTSGLDETYNADEPLLSLLRNFNYFDQNLQQMPQDILYGMEVIQQVKPFLSLFSDLKVIHDTYEKFRRVQSTILRKNEVEEQLLIAHIIDDVLYDPKNNVNKTLLNIFNRMFTDDRNDNIIYQIFNVNSESDYICKNYNQPPQQVVYNLYNTIALTQLKGYIMIQFSYLVKHLEEEGNYKEISVIARKEFEASVYESFSFFRNLMEILSTSSWRCDPKSHIKGETYDELTGLIQGHIENEVDMNSDNSCAENCGAYSLTANYGCFDGNSEYCKKRKSCSGRIFNCRFIESDMTACISPISSPRRYEYVKYHGGPTLGRETQCSTENIINSWQRWFVHCSYCFCLCDQQGLYSDRYFNLRPVMADIYHNRVVTGLRIVKHNRIIHLQIQEGKLLPYGYIDTSTIRRVPVEDYRITDYGIENGVDFHTMSYETRSMYLDDLKLHDTNYVITGVQFQFIDNSLRLQIIVQGFNFEYGVLSTYPFCIMNGTHQRQKIDIDDSDIPIYSPPSEPNWSTNQYIEFTHTSIDKDAAQTTVPFFDTQPVVLYPAVPLQGAGLYYKGIPGYGGFIAPKITAYDFKNHFKMAFPTMNTRGGTDNDN